jgi:Fe-S-cluster-containing hydrogenase component 2
MYVDLKTGARVIDEKKCTGCGSCAAACPLMPEKIVIKYKVVASKRIYFKCDLCSDRSKGPVCVEACPSSAITFSPIRGR